MGKTKPILSDAEAGLLAALVGLVPSIGRWIECLAGDDPETATRRVREILPERSASQAVADELRQRG